MLSRARYLRSLERDINAQKEIINNLVQENFELKEILKMVQLPNDNSRTYQKRA